MFSIEKTMVTVVQPRYDVKSDEKIRQFILNQLSELKENSILVFPEYSNAAGISDNDEKKNAMKYADELLKEAACAAKKKNSIVAINVLEKRNNEIKNSTYLFGRNGEVVFVYDKQHLPKAEKEFGIKSNAICHCICDYEGIRYAFLTCYDVYFNEQIEYIAKQKPDVIFIPSYQRGERQDIIEAQTKMIAFRCNAYVLRSSYAMQDKNTGGCSMIVKPDGNIMENLKSNVGVQSSFVDLKEKYYRSAGFGEKLVRNDDFINAGLCPVSFQDSKNDDLK